MSPTHYRILADLVLYLHAGFVLFVISGLLLIIVGGVCGWRWVRSLWFRIAHLGAIGFVVVQSWLGAICPLTLLENHLRQRAGDAVYGGSFIAHWVQSLLFYQAPEWVFVVIYTVFGLLVVATLYWVKPERRR